jgi:DNA-directed RNA polymerase specialized sigma24 family protein
VQITPGLTEPRAVHSETDLEVLARTLIDLRREGMEAEEIEVLYAHHVLGFSIAELATATGRDRRSLYARRDRGRRRLCA